MFLFELKANGLLRDPAVELNVNGIQLARLGNLIAAKYNKAEAVEYFMRELPNCDTAIFVDDNFDNVFNVFSRFAQLELRKPENSLTVHSVWYEPPAEGRPEPCSARNMTLGLRIARPIPTLEVGPRRARAVFEGVGELGLRQQDGLSRMEAEWTGDQSARFRFGDDHAAVSLNDFGFSQTLFGALSIVGKVVSLADGAKHHHQVKVQLVE